MESSDSSSAQYIHMVHHLIEECIIFKMSKEECMESLSRHANINPVITSTVWKELEKENKEFFEAYTNRREEKVHKIKATEEHMANDEANARIFLSDNDVSSHN